MDGGREPVVSELSRTQCAVGAWRRCCRETSMDKGRRGGVGGVGVEEGLLTHLGAGGGVMRARLLTSGQPCKSRKPRRWPWSKVSPVNLVNF